MADDVLDGFVAQAAGDGGFVRRLLFGGEDAVGVGDERGARDVEGVEEEQFSITAGGVGEVRIGAEALRGELEGLGGGHGNRA